MSADMDDRRRAVEEKAQSVAENLVAVKGRAYAELVIALANAAVAVGNMCGIYHNGEDSDKASAMHDLFHTFMTLNSNSLKQIAFSSGAIRPGGEKDLLADTEAMIKAMMD